MLALGRRSQLPAVRLASVIYIEFVRGVPFITVLFMADNLLPLFLPPGWGADRLLRPLVGVAMFSAAYMAEEVRGGLQALSRGQYEGAMALGLDYWRMMRLVVLPQALAMVIPGIVNNFIGLFKDTTLVAIVGVTDFLAAMDSAFKDTVWAGPSLLATGYAFAAAFYFCVLLCNVRLFEGRRAAPGGRPAAVTRRLSPHFWHKSCARYLMSDETTLPSLHRAAASGFQRRRENLCFGAAGLSRGRAALARGRCRPGAGASRRRDRRRHGQVSQAR